MGSQNPPSALSVSTARLPAAISQTAPVARRQTPGAVAVPTPRVIVISNKLSVTAVRFSKEKACTAYARGQLGIHFIARPGITVPASGRAFRFQCMCVCNLYISIPGKPRLLRECNASRRCQVTNNSCADSLQQAHVHYMYLSGKK